MIPRGGARTALLDAAIDVIRAQGLHATTVDDLCVAAGVSKGAFFHHFDTKEALAVAAADYWSETTGGLFAGAAYHAPKTGYDRIMAYLDFRASLVVGDAADFSCLVGTMIQEAFDTNPEIRAACAASIFGHAATLEADFRDALDAAAKGASSAPSLARHTQTVLQGSFVLAKAADDPTLVLESLDHLRRYLECVLAPATT